MSQGTELIPLKISRNSDAQKTRRLRAKMKSLEKLGKPPLAILEDDLEELTEEDFEILNPHEINIKMAIEKKIDIRNKNKELELKRKKLAHLQDADSRLKPDYGAKSDVRKLKKEIEDEELHIETVITDAILDEFGEGKRKRKKTHKKSKKKHTKKHRKKHPKKERKKTHKKI